MTSPHGAAAWVLFGFQVAGVVGTFAAVTVALTLGVRAARRDSRLRDEAALAQARLVVPLMRATSEGWSVEVANDSEHSVTAVRASVAIRPGRETARVPPWRLHGPESQRLVRSGSPERFLFAPPGGHDGKWYIEDSRGNKRLPQVNTDDYLTTIQWTDSAGRHWHRIDLSEPQERNTAP